jgi:hypothetical protein
MKFAGLTFLTQASGAFMLVDKIGLVAKQAALEVMPEEL